MGLPFTDIGSRAGQRLSDWSAVVSQRLPNAALRSAPRMRLSGTLKRFVEWWDDGSDDPDMRALVEAMDDGGDASHPTEGVSPWAPDRLAAIEAVWGSGFLVPGGETYARKLLAVLGLSSKQTVLDLTADLGGTARTIADQNGLWMDAFEPVEELAAEGQRRSVVAGLGKRVPVTPVDVDTLELKADRYHTIYTRERLFSIGDKDRILDQCAAGLKSQGQFLLTDFMAPEGDAGSGELAALSRTGDRCDLWTARKYCDELKRRGFQIAIVDNRTEEYQSLIVQAWMKLLGEVREGNVARTWLGSILDEGALWSRRWQALQNGDAVLGRISARIAK